MSTEALRKPNPVIVDQLNQIADIGTLSNKFVPLKDTHKTTKEWNKAFVFGAFVLGCLAAFAYKRVNQYAAIGLGLAAVVVAYKKSREDVTTELPEYTNQCKEIRKIFEGVVEELQIAGDVAATLITKAVVESTLANVNRADKKTKSMVEAYISADTWWITSDPIKASSEDQKPWRESFKTFIKPATTIAKLQLDKLKTDNSLHPVLREEVLKVIPMATRMLYGKKDGDENTVYIENKMVGENLDAKLVSAPWKV